MLFYFTLLFVSVALFFVTFRRSRFCLLLLMLYLAAHYFALDYAQTPGILAIQNSRFFPVLALLPALYLLLLVVTRARPTLALLAVAAVQTFILMFMVFCRTQTFWEVLAIVLADRPYRHWIAAAAATSFVAFHVGHWPAAIGKSLLETWPAALAVLGTVILLAYGSFAPNSAFYSRESKAHLFWHDLYASTVSADPTLYAIYGYGLPDFSDDMSYVAAVHDLRGRNDGASPIAEVVDGVLDIDIFKSNGIYDQEMRRLYFRVVREHPWLVLRSFVIGKPLAQISYFRVTPELWDPRNYVSAVPVRGALKPRPFWRLRSGRSRLPTTRTALTGVAVAAGSCSPALSTLTSFFYPTALIAEVLVTWLILVMLCAIYLPLALFFYFLRRSRPAAASSQATFQETRLAVPEFCLDAAQNQAETAVAFVRQGVAVGRPYRDIDVAIGRHQIEPYLLPAIGALVEAALFDDDVAVANRMVGETENRGEVMWWLSGRLVAEFQLDVAAARRLDPGGDPIDLVPVQPAELTTQGVETVLRRCDRGGSTGWPVTTVGSVSGLASKYAMAAHWKPRVCTFGTASAGASCAATVVAAGAGRADGAGSCGRAGGSDGIEAVNSGS